MPDTTREKSDRRYAERLATAYGAIAYCEGDPLDSCPYEDPALAAHWRRSYLKTRLWTESHCTSYQPAL